MKTLSDLKQWSQKIGKFAGDNHIQVVEDTPQRYRFLIYTDNNSYSITANVKEGGRSYLGCIASNRKPRAGETWTRGNDLADGPLDEETLNRILCDIISYEMVKVHKTKTSRGPKTVPEGVCGSLVT